MRKYGIIKNGKLEIRDQSFEGSKPIEYEVIPDFCQVTQYVIQKNPEEKEEAIFFGIEVKEVPEEYYDESDEE